MSLLCLLIIYISKQYDIINDKMITPVSEPAHFYVFHTFRRLDKFQPPVLKWAHLYDFRTFLQSWKSKVNFSKCCLPHILYSVGKYSMERQCKDSVEKGKKRVKYLRWAGKENLC